MLLAKYDSAAKGGTVISICRSLSVPIAFVGTGETYKDLRIFDGKEYLSGLFDVE